MSDQTTEGIASALAKLRRGLSYDPGTYRGVPEERRISELTPAEAVAVLAALEQSPEPRSNDADWLWGQFMDLCRRKGMSPGSHNELFAIVGRLRERQSSPESVCTATDSNLPAAAETGSGVGGAYSSGEPGEQLDLAPNDMDAIRFRFLCADIDDRELRAKRNQLLERMAVMSESAARTDIDYLMANHVLPEIRDDAIAEAHSRLMRGLYEWKNAGGSVDEVADAVRQMAEACCTLTKGDGA